MGKAKVNLDLFSRVGFLETWKLGAFYIKAQTYAENEFFPGSIKKKNFLGALAKHLLINLEDASVFSLAKAVKKSFDEKQMVVFFEDENVQQQINALQWSGRILTPQCPVNQKNPCVNDFIFV